jgi:hypothetical protein
MSTQTTTPPAPLVPTSAMATEPACVDLENDPEAMSERFFAGALATLELATIHLGLRLALHQRCTISDPSAAASDEWLESGAALDLTTTGRNLILLFVRSFDRPPRSPCNRVADR